MRSYYHYAHKAIIINIINNIRIEIENFKTRNLNYNFFTIHYSWLFFQCNIKRNIKNRTVVYILLSVDESAIGFAEFIYLFCLGIIKDPYFVDRKARGMEF